MSPKQLDDRTLCLVYTTGRDVAGLAPADRALLTYDIWTNLAHATMLAEMAPPVLTADELSRVKAALNDLDRQADDEAFEIDFGKPGAPDAVEDVHFFVERYVCRHAGDEAGRKLHTARSRNDQVTTDLRLLVRDQTVYFARQVAALGDVLLEKAREHHDVLMPGYTHHQHGAVSTLGFLWLAHAEALMRDLERLAAVARLADRCPLGAVMSFGTSWPIDRARVAELLAFGAVQVNNLDAVASRGEIEASLVAALAQLMNHLAGLAQDLLLMTSEEFAFFRVADAFTTGSSVMPQKRNLDFAEVTKAKAAAIGGALQAMLGISRGNLTGYNRDTQWTKTALLDATREAALAPRIFTRVLATLTVDDAHRATMLGQCRTGYLNAIDVADFLAADKSVPFRTAHGVVKAAVDAARAASPPIDALTPALINDALAAAGLTLRLTDAEVDALSDPLANLSRRRNLGSPNPTETRRRADELAVELNQASAEWAARADHIRTARDALR